MMSYQDFQELSHDEKLTYLTKLRSESSINDILEQWGITRPVYYAIAHEVGLPLKRRGTGKTEQKAPVKRPRKTSVPMPIEEPVNGNRVSFSIDTSGPLSLVSNILSAISDLDNKPVHVKMDVEVL